MSPETKSLRSEQFTRKEGSETVTDQITLTPYSLDQALEIFTLIDNNREFFTEFDTDWTNKYKTQDQLEESIRAQEEGKQRFLIQNMSNEVVGGCRIKIDDDDPKSAEIGYFIDQHQTMKRYATQTVLTLINYATNQMNLDKLHAYVNPTNLGSVRVLEGNGFEYSGLDNGDPNYHRYIRSLQK